MRFSNFQTLSMICLLFMFGLSCSKIGDGSGREINSEQLQKRGNGLFYAINEEKPYSGKAVELYENGQKKFEQRFSNGKLHGFTTSWYDNGQKEEEISYQNGIQIGPYRAWYDNGQQKFEKSVSNGKLHGLTTSWYSDGQKQEEVSYQNGKRTGLYRGWYDNGQQYSEGFYREGKEEGQWSFWTRNGEKRETGVMTDIDNNEYQTVKIGNQWWMAENLRVTHYRNGDDIPNITDKTQWANFSDGAYCYYDNNSSYAPTYGALYNWNAVNDSRNLAPDGWHVPTAAEWQTLVDYLGGDSVAGGKMKETGTTNWASPNTGATNECRFTARPGGYRDYRGGRFDGMGGVANFWSATAINMGNAWRRPLANNTARANGVYDEDMRSGNSVRCIRD